MDTEDAEVFQVFFGECNQRFSAFISTSWTVAFVNVIALSSVLKSSSVETHSEVDIR